MEISATNGGEYNEGRWLAEEEKTTRVPKTYGYWSTGDTVTGMGSGTTRVTRRLG